MGWLEDWLTDLAEPTKVRRARTDNRLSVDDEIRVGLDGKPRRMPEIKTVWFQTSSPSDEDGDPGEVEAARYSVTTDGVLTMHDEEGKPIGKEYVLAKGEAPKTVAYRLAREAWLKTGGTDFNRRITYPALFVA